MKKVLAIFLVFIMVHAASIAFGGQSSSGVVTLSVDLSAQEPGREARLWIPYPVSDAHQVVSDIVVTGDFAASGVYTDRVFGTPILYAQWPKEAKSRTFTFSFAVERLEIRQTGFPAVEP